MNTVHSPRAVPGRQISFCTPPHASDIHHVREREIYVRNTSDDLFISELWRLLDDYEIIKPQTFSFISNGQESRIQDRKRLLNHVNKEYNQGIADYIF